MTLKLQNIKSSIWANFFIPIILYGLGFLFNIWSVSLLIFIFGLLIIKKEYLLIFFFFLSFFNIMQLDNTPLFGSLITTFLGVFLILIRQNKISRKTGYALMLSLLGSAIIIFNFFIFSFDKFYIKTSIKSTLQLLFILFLIAVFSLLKEEFIKKNFEIVKQHFHKFLLCYLIIAVFFAFDDRLDAYTGAQCLAFQLAIINLYYFNKDIPISYKVAFLFFLVLTGSRTYVFLVLGFFLLRMLSTVSLRMKIILFSAIPILIISAYYVLPLLSDRFDFSDALFLGTLTGRFHNYFVAFDLIGSKPFFGNGMGSMILTLKSYAESRPEYIPLQDLYYGVLERGETNIMHNEYLRILTEVGFIGFALFLIALYLFYKRLKTKFNRHVFYLLLICFLIENIFTLYSTGMITFFLFSLFMIYEVKQNNNNVKV